MYRFPKQWKTSRLKGKTARRIRQTAARTAITNANMMDQTAVILEGRDGNKADMHDRGED